VAYNRHSGHYDILYKIGDVPEPMSESQVQIHQMGHAPLFGSNNLLYSHHDLDLEQYLPGISTSGVSSTGLSSGDLQPTAFSQDIFSNPRFGSHGLPITPEPYPMSHYPNVQSPPIQSPMPAEASGQGAFRASKFELELGYHKLSNPYVMEDCKTDAMKS
jgi:hypothetical protein